MSEPRAKVVRLGRWSYLVYVEDGLIRYGPFDGYGWTVLGKERAEKKARRKLRSYLRKQCERESWTIAEDGCE